MTDLSLSVDSWFEHLAATVPWALSPVFVLRDVPTTWLELIAVVLALLMVTCTILEKH